MYFKDRTQAAKLLAARLKEYRGKNPLVLAIPRGAVPMGKVLADELGGELDVVLVRKLGAPGNPELAIGSVGEDGRAYLGEYAASVGKRYLEEEKTAQLEVLRRRRAMYTAVRPPTDPAGRLVIVLDDGLATGSTMIAALRALRGRKPRRLVAAAAVSSPQAVGRIEALADEAVFLHVPPELFAVGNYFEDFSAVTDEEVVEVLREAQTARTPPS